MTTKRATKSKTARKPKAAPKKPRAVKAKPEDKKLSDCSPNCSSSRVQRIERDYLFANVSLGVGALGLLGAAAWLVFAPGKSDASHAAQSIELKIGADHATITGSF